MRIRSCSLGLLLISLSVPLHGTDLGRAEGSVAINYVSTPLRFAYARSARRADPNEKIQILLTSHPLSRKALDDDEALSTMRRQRQIAVVEVLLDDKRRAVRTVIRKAHDFQVNFMKSELVTTISSARLIDGSMDLDKDFFGDQIALHVAFRVALGPGEAFAENPAANAAIALGEQFPAPPPIFDMKSRPAAARQTKTPASAPARALEKGIPLPKGGGEPGAAYLAYTSAFRRGDFPKLKTLMTAEAAKEFEQVPTELLPLARAVIPFNIEVVGGSVSENKAVLRVKGTPTPGGGSSGTATMMKVGGSWKFAGEQWAAATPAEVAATAAAQPKPITPVTTGTPLPVGGGEAGKAWRAYDSAMNKGDIAGIKRVMVKEHANAKEFDQLAGIIDLVRGSRGVNAKVVGGLIRGDKATLRLEGSPATLAELTGSGTVTLVKEDGVWKVADENWTPKPTPR